MRTVTFATTQFACTWNRDENLALAERLVRQAAAEGAHVILLQELFETPYFCATQEPAHFALAKPVDEHPTVRRFQALARELCVVLPISVFERAGNVFFNSVIVVDADGRVVGHYRKSHIPQGPGYEEKYFFSPGDTGFRPIRTRFGQLGIAICWDQWFPEAARSLVLQGAEFLLYPTAIGSEPPSPGYDSKDHWQTVMRGHAAANIVPVIASNRIGRERAGSTEITFYGSSFISGPTGQVLRESDRVSAGVSIQSVDLEECARLRASWGLFRDRRTDLYGAIGSLSGDLPALQEEFR